MNQRDTLRNLVDRFGDDVERLVAEYAAAERRGEISRGRNRSRLTPEEYAVRLLADARKKGGFVD